MGLLEVHGLTAAIGAADAMAKAAPVRVEGPHLAGQGLVTIVARGDVASVTEAVSAGLEAARRLGRVHASRVIGRPGPDVAAVLVATQAEVTPSTI
jgi:microcompartment protein CcmL/EutN